MANTRNLRMDQGSAFIHTFVLPIDLTAYTLRGHVRKSKFSDETLFEASTATSGLTITDAPNGKFVLEIPADTSAAWLAESAAYDIEIVDSLGRPTRVVQGTIFINREVTR